MSTPILTTKLYIPPVRPNWVPRPRLIKRLDLDPGAGQTARPFLETPQLPAFDHLMTLLLNDLAGLSERSVLALDDYHTIS